MKPRRVLDALHLGGLLGEHAAPRLLPDREEERNEEVGGLEGVEERFGSLAPLFRPVKVLLDLGRAAAAPHLGVALLEQDLDRPGVLVGQPQALAARAAGDLLVRDGRGVVLDAGHLPDEVAEQQELGERVLVQAVEDVLEQRLHLGARVLQVHVAHEGREVQQPPREIRAVVLEHGLVDHQRAAQLLNDHERQHVEGERGEVAETLAADLDHALVLLDLVEHDLDDKDRVRVAQLPDSAALFGHILLRHPLQQLPHLLLDLRALQHQLRVLRVYFPVQLRVQPVPFQVRQRPDGLPELA
mmetsp:Transcript_53233/g.125821  ORF Transcript_53233/g.125821 Transcript_53233/m.125821 type:complete len:300 (-) Transcript_53233:42-941(-)